MADDKIFDAKDLLGDFKKETEKAKQEVAKELQEVGKSIIADVKAMKQDVKKQVESQQKLVGKIEADIDVVLSSDNISDTVKQQMTTIKKEIEKETKKSTATKLSASFSVINKGQIKDAQRLGGQVRTAYESALEGKKNAPKRFVEYFSAGKYKDSIDSEYGFAIPFKEKEFSEMENYYNELITNNKQLQEVAKLASQEMENQIHLIEQQRKATGALREQLYDTNIKKSSPSSQQSGNQTPLSSDSKAKKYNIANRNSVPKLKSDIDSSDEDSDIDEITNAYKILINTEKRYQNLKRKETEGIITPTEIGNLKMLTEERERANRITENAISLNEEQIKISKKYATVQSDVEKAILETAKANEKLIASRLQEEIDKIETNKKDFKYDSAYEAELNSVSDTIKALNMQAENLEFVDEEDIQDFVRLRQAAESALDALKTKTNNLQFKTPDVEDVKKKMVEIQKVMDQNTKMPREMKETFEALQNKYKLLIDTKGSVSQFKALNAELEDMIFNLQKSGKTGKSFFSQIGQRLTDMNAKFFATYFSLQDIIRYTRQGFETIKEYDAALTEMNKVSKESIQTLKEFQEESFALANSVGTAASQIQNSTADFLRLGESFEQAKESAQDANALFKVSEFTDISEATDALIAMSAAYKELEKSEINDILNYTGNNFSISTSELASALQKSAATLKVAGNDIYEATALVTAGNAVLQDAETVGAGLKMISLRILGTEEAKDELASLGEDVDDFVVQTKSKIDETVRNYTAVASNEFKGISVLDDNGNYKSTYEILRDISQVYQEILEADKKAGTNRGQALLEVLAGKNRSNVAASILSNPELLTSVYEETLTKSQGSVTKEMESQLQSIESHLNTLKNTWEKLWVNENNREVINLFIDFGTQILETIDKIGILRASIIGLVAGIGIKKMATGGGRAKSLPSKYATESFSREVCEININVHWYANI